jgi:beta-fructofuranosidase
MVMPASQSKGARDFFYRPQNAWVGDIIPFYKDGKFRLFYFHDWRDVAKYGAGGTFYQVSTEDFVHYTEHGEMLPRGTTKQQDYSIGTGSVIEANGLYHFFYTGSNMFLFRQGNPQNVVMHAVSDDLRAWRKIPEDTFLAPTAIYERDDWRDPFVFWNEEAQEYWMLLNARVKSGPSRRRGCTALCASKDLTKWEGREPFWAPSLYYGHECTDLFKMGEWWYLVFSEFSESVRTRYRMSRSLKGPWVAPENDTFDGRAYYAAKTASDGQRRFIFGWSTTRADNKDYHAWQWGGNMVVHEVVQGKDGTLYVRVPESVDKALSDTIAFQFKPGIGSCEIGQKAVKILAPYSLGCAVAGTMPDRCKITATVDFTENTHACGIMLRVSDDLERAYYVRLEPSRNRLVFDAWPRAGDVPFMVELERPIALSPGMPTELKVFVDGTIAEIYVAGKITMSTRMYGLPQGAWGVFVSEGNAQFRDLGLFGLSEQA